MDICSVLMTNLLLFSNILLDLLDDNLLFFLVFETCSLFELKFGNQKHYITNLCKMPKFKSS